MERGDFYFHPLVHDELNVLVRDELVLEITPRIMDIMTVQEKDWAIPMTVEVSFGHDWGTIFPFKRIGYNEFVPKVEK